MTEPKTVQAWFQGGPAAGAIRPVERELDGRPPALLMFCAGALFIGRSDEPVPSAHAAYELERAPVATGLWLYRHVGTLTG